MSRSTTAILKIRTAVTAGIGIKPKQHGLRVRTGVKAGGIKQQHDLRVRTAIRAGGPPRQHGLGVR